MCAMQDVNYRAQIPNGPRRTGSCPRFRETGLLVAQRLRPLRLISHTPGRRRQSVISKSAAMRNLSPCKGNGSCKTNKDFSRRSK